MSAWQPKVIASVAQGGKASEALDPQAVQSDLEAGALAQQTAGELTGESLGAVEAVERGVELDLGLWLGGDLYLSSPAALLLLPLLAVFALLGRTSKRRSIARMGTLAAGVFPKSLRQRLAPLVGLLLAVGVVLMTLALARPVRADVLRADVSEGVDILLVIDRSGSMEERDMARGATRLDVVKKVAADFAERRTNDAVGAADSIGVMAFAAYPSLLLPFTLDSEMIQATLSGITELNPYSSANGNGVGVALTKAAQVLSESEAESRVVVLLTDGQNNVPAIDPLDAAAFAAAENVRVHTILAGRGVSRDPRAMQARSELRGIAEETGGQYFAAENIGELEAIYGLIEELERTPRERRRFVATQDLYPSLLGPGLACYLLAWLVRVAFVRRSF